MDKRTLFKQYFGHSEFRPGQEPLVDALLGGRDALGVLRQKVRREAVVV